MKKTILICFGVALFGLTIGGCKDETYPSRRKVDVSATTPPPMTQPAGHELSPYDGETLEQQRDRINNAQPSPAPLEHPNVGPGSPLITPSPTQPPVDPVPQTFPR